jgi:hypothetical protein
MADTRHTPGGHHDGHDRSEVSFRAIGMSLATIALVSILAGVVVLVMFRYIDQRIVESEPVESPVAIPSGQLPPEPRLQANERADLAALRKAEDEKLTTYGWVDESAGVARIPIERAKALLLERGLPTR